MFFRPKFDLKKNVIHIISLSCNPVPPIRYGGIELVIAHLCEGLVAEGAQVICYSPGHFDIPGARHFQTIPAPSKHIKDGGVPNSSEHLYSVLNGLKENARSGDVVLFNHPDHYRFLKKKLGLAFRFTRHIAEVAHWVDAGAQKNIIYPSAHLMRDLKRPGVVIPHGEKLIFCEPAAHPQDYLFFAGRITKDKGVDIALEACNKLNISLVLAGPLNDKTFSDEILSDQRVTYLGELTYEELIPHYSQASALVYMTQYTEPFGLSVIEAMATGCPVITTGKGGTGETVVPGATGYFCQTADDIVQAYSKLNKISRQACIERAKNYSVALMAESYLSFFGSL